MEQRDRAAKNTTEANYYNGHQRATMDALLEVLLDIREQLQTIYQVMPEGDQFTTG